LKEVIFGYSGQNYIIAGLKILLFNFLNETLLVNNPIDFG